MGRQFDPDFSVANKVQVWMVLLAFCKRTDIVEQSDAVAESFQVPVAADAGAIVRQLPFWYRRQLGFSLSD